MAPRRYSDPVHRIITLDREEPSDRLLMALIDAPEVQRLRRIRQLGLAFVAFQGAEHSRFAHSLGVMHTMTLALDALQRSGVALEAEVRLCARAAALLHDLGHGPFSHVMEKVLGQRHEDWTARILLSPETAVHRILAAHEPTLPERLAHLMAGAFQPRFVAQLVASQLDCDRFDYLLRDSLMTGVSYGCYDLPWILNALAVDAATGQLIVRARGVLAVEEYLFARYHMFRRVYFHHALRAAENMLVAMFRRAVALAAAGSLVFRLPESAMDKLLTTRPLTPLEYLSLDDADVLFHIKQWQREPDPTLSDLARRFLERRLFKSLDVSDLAPEQRADLRAAIADALLAHGLAPECYLLEDDAGDVPYFGPYAPDAPDRRIVVEEGRANPRLREISEVSAAVAGLRPYRLHRLCFPEEARAAAQQAHQRLAQT
ncbi:MAG: HD domain-containing protein [Chloracidobacterium sp.]|uniref:HD domain-containing protein n=1 Tax=Chloracidobacterium validum TaxID=2821543 RepID=A0ABX8BCL7_9BACT|nr:HD domain-containing protein [Chloracidobacterium validum]QUW03550.1 HD domain-containing protein [Chloracidobacterium validum]